MRVALWEGGSSLVGRGEWGCPIAALEYTGQFMPRCVLFSARYTSGARDRLTYPRRNTWLSWRLGSKFLSTLGVLNCMELPLILPADKTNVFSLR